MKNDAASVRNAKTRALKPRTLKPGEMLEEGSLPPNATVTTHVTVQVNRAPTKKRRHVAVDFPLFAISELFRITGKTIRGTLKLIAHVFLLDVAAKGAGKFRQRRRVRLAIAAHDRSRRLRLPPEGVEAMKLTKPKAAKSTRDALPLDYASSDRIEPRVALPKRVGRPSGARDKHPRKKRVS